MLNMISKSFNFYLYVLVFEKTIILQSLLMSLDQANLLKAWQHYIEITGCEKSKIPVKTINNCQNIIFTHSDFIENPKSNGVFIEIQPSKIAHLKEKFVIFDEDTEKDKLIDPLSFAFPLLTMHEKNQSFYLPIFVIDLPADFLISENFTGFDISSNLPNFVKVNISVLTNYFDVDADQIDESRNIIDLIGLICETTFIDFESMYFGFIEWANEKLVIKNNNFKNIFFARNTGGLIYSSKNDDVNTSDLEDFKFILHEIEIHGENCVSSKYPLLNEYLTKIGGDKSVVVQQPVHLVKTYGLFESKYSLGRGQFQAIQAANIKPELPLIAVQGAPGTGKTTLFKSLIAQQVTARALSVISGNDQNLNMLVCSTAIKAVDNVIADLKAEDFTQNLNWLWLHGGAKAKLDMEIQSRLAPHIADLELKEFDEIQYLELKDQILNLKKNIDAIGERFLTEKSTLNLSKAKIPFITSLNDYNSTELFFELSKYQTAKSINLDEQYRYDSYSTNQLTDIQSKLKVEVADLEKEISQINEALAHVGNLLAYWPKKFNSSQFSDWMLNKKVRGSFSLSFGDFFKLQFLKIITIFSPAKINLIDACETLTKHDLLLDLEQNLIYINNQLMIINQMLLASLYTQEFNSLYQSFTKEYTGCNDLSDIFRFKAISENRKIFELSIQFLYQEQLRRKVEVVQALNHWLAMLSSDNVPTPHYGKFIKDSEKFYQLISLAYPVVATTLASVFKMSGFKKLQQLNGTKPWNLALLDEAGMVSVENLVPIVARSNKAMIVGDPLQLEPIRTISKPSEQKIYKEYFYCHDDEYAMLGPGQVTTYHRASGTLSGEISDIGDGIILDEHRRCQEPIAQLFIDIAKYKGLSISSFTPSERIQKAFEGIGAHHLMFYHVDGARQSGKTNLDEVRGIGELLDQLEQAGYNLTCDIGIITPYADQKRQLISAYGQRMEQNKLAKIGTIHQFQGVGFEVIIFSPVIFEQADSAAFLNSRPNILNVAVSRAKQQFIVVGNYHKLKDSKGSLGLIAERTSSDFYLELGNQSPSFKDYETSFVVKKHIYDVQHVKAFEYYLQNSQKSIVIVVPWIRKPYNTSTQQQLELLKIAKGRGINIKVYYGYSNLELNQKDDNDEQLVQDYITALGTDNVIRLPQGTHEKVLIIDDRILIVGSWNWLSNAYYKWYENQQNGRSQLAIRRETSIIIMDRKTITEYKAHNLAACI